MDKGWYAIKLNNQTIIICYASIITAVHDDIDVSV